MFLTRSWKLTLIKNRNKFRQHFHIVSDDKTLLKVSAWSENVLGATQKDPVLSTFGFHTISNY